MKKNCIVCGTEFEAKSAKGVYCGSACKMKDMRSKKKGEVKSTFAIWDQKTEQVISQEFPLNEPVTIKLRREDTGQTIPAEMTIRPPEWAEKIIEYCGIIGMTPEELIIDHKRMAAIKSFKMPDQIDKSKFKFATLDELSEQNQERAKEYDPFKNPRFKSKIGPQKEGE